MIADQLEAIAAELDAAARRHGGLALRLLAARIRDLADHERRPHPLPKGVTDAEGFAQWRTANSGTYADYLARGAGQ